MRKFLALLITAFSLSILSGNTVMADTSSGTSFEVTKTATPSTVSPSAIVNFTISITNIDAGGLNQTPQTVIDTLPAGFTFADDSQLTKLDGTQVTFPPSSVDGQIVTWTFGGEFTEAIPLDQNVVISYSATAPEVTGSYENTACLTTPEEVCASAQIIVQTSPQAGLKENMIIALGLAIVLVLGGFFYRQKKHVSFEEAMLTRIK